MRADRLLAMLLLLQNRGRLTARQLAEELEVSIRTVFRDVEALGNAGIPVYTIRGPHGGFELFEGYRTHLTGLTGEEAESLFLVGMPGPASELGLGDAQARVELKLIEALPASMRLRAEELRSRFHHDPTAWFQPEPSRNLAVLTQAVWQRRLIEIGEGELARTVEPLALTLKVGTWHLVARSRGATIVHRVDELVEVRLTRARFERPPDFDLAAEWDVWVRRQEDASRGLSVVADLSPSGLRIARTLFERLVVPTGEDPRSVAREPDWVRVELAFPSLDQAADQLTRLGPDVEVVEPPALRARMARAAATTAALYRAGMPS